MNIPRRRFIKSAAIVGLMSPAILRAATRNLFQSTQIFYCGTGTTFGSITGLTPDFPNVQAAANDLYNNEDCGGQQVDLRILDGFIDPGFRFSGIIVGERGFSGVVVRASSLGAAIIRPAGGSCAVALDSGAAISIAELQMDGGVQGAAGHPQDIIQLGQGSKLAMYGSNRTIQYSSTYNALTAVNSTVDLMPQSWGSTIQNGGHWYVQGTHQDFIQTDQGAQVACDVNDNHGLYELHPEASSYRSVPYCGVAWLDVAMGKILVSGMDASGGVGGDGYKVRYRDGGYVDFGLPVNPNDLNKFLVTGTHANGNNIYPNSTGGGIT